ncbi:MAG TPA: LLM class F420-dependent oxidoreductase [Candidatus Binatia bacterium]|nr:LLM class F420-dependent oxidoreductase [Candidatus Binatia bacterium]
MKYGVFLPVSGRAASRKTLMQAAQQAESLGYDSVWAADRLVMPWKIDTAYPYSKESTFIVPPDRPFFDTLTCLAFLAGCTETIQLGMSVMVLPYRHPLHWAKIATTIDQLSTGRLIMGVGVGWMEEEFAAMNAPFKERGAVSDEQLTLLKQLWTEEHITFRGKYYNVNDIAFNPKPYRKPRVPIWVGGEGKYAQRRAGRYGDAWFPYFVRITPAELAARFEYVRKIARESGRSPDELTLTCCLPIELTPDDAQQEENYLKGSVEQVTDRLKIFQKVGVTHIGLQFMVPHYPERQEQIERFAKEALPALKAYGKT